MTRFGVQLPGVLPLERYGALARAAEDAGFDWIGVPDNILQKPPWPILAEVAAATSRALIGPDVTNPFTRHPVVTASHLAVLHEQSEGRAFLGLGAGALLPRIGLAGARPARAVAETIDVVEHLLSGSAEAWDGQEFRIEAGTVFRFDPGMSMPPVYIAGSGPRMLELAARRAAGALSPVWSASAVAALTDTLSASAGVRRGELEICVYAWTSVGEDRDAAYAVAREHLAVYLPVLGASAVAAAGGRASVIDDIFAARSAGRPPAAAVDDDTVRCFMAVGTPAEVVAQARAVMGTGVDRIVFAHPLGPDLDRSLDLLAGVVLPALI